MAVVSISDRLTLARAIRAEEKLLRAAYLDPVTGFYSRRLISTIVEEQVARAARSGGSFAVVGLDLDHFRRINTAFGQAFGDAVLREVAGRLSRHTGDDDSLARVAPDEFLLVLPGRDPGLALDRWLTMLLRAVTEHPVTIDGRDIFVSARIGVATYPDDGGDAASLVARLGQALARPRHSGPAADGPDLFLLEANLHRALDREELRLFYQPQVDLRSGQVVAAESLLRWPRPDLSMISPAIFVPLAETTGLIGPISAWVVKRLLADLGAWTKTGSREFTVAFNLSAQLFAESWLDRILLPALEASGIPPGRIKFELTETALIEDEDQTLRAMERVRKRGFMFALDDFGTGYSSLSHLHRFPIDEIKIDKSFIAAIHNGERERRIIAAIIDLAHALDMTVVAEGIETPEQACLVRDLGCDLGQGYLFDRALPAPDFAARLNAIHALP